MEGSLINGFGLYSSSQQFVVMICCNYCLLALRHSHVASDKDRKYTNFSFTTAMSSLFYLLYFCFVCPTAQCSTGYGHALQQMRTEPTVQKCHFCKRPVTSENGFLHNNFTRRKIETCEPHCSIDSHHLCFLWHASKPTELANCFVCCFDASSSAHEGDCGFLTVIINGLRNKPAKALRLLDNIVLKDSECDLIEHFTTFGASSDSFPYSPVLSVETIRQARNKPKTVAVHKSYSVYGGAKPSGGMDTIEGMFQYGVREKMVGKILCRFNRQFFYELPNNMVLDFFRELASIKDFNNCKPFRFLEATFNAFVLEKLHLLSDHEKYALCNFFVEERFIGALSILLRYSKICHVEFSADIILRLISSAMETISPDARNGIGTLALLINMLPVVQPQNGRILSLQKALVRSQKKTSLTWFAGAYFSRFIYLQNTLSGLGYSDLVQCSETVSKQLVTSMIRAKSSYLSVRTAKAEFLRLESRQLLPAVFDEAIYWVSASDAIHLHYNMVLTHYLIVGWFWDRTKTRLENQAKGFTDGEIMMGRRLVVLLLENKRCDLEETYEILLILEKNMNMDLFSYCFDMISSRLDFPTAPVSILDKFYDLVRETDEQLLFLFLVNLSYGNEPISLPEAKMLPPRNNPPSAPSSSPSTSSSCYIEPPPPYGSEQPVLMPTYSDHHSRHAVNPAVASGALDSFNDSGCYVPSSAGPLHFQHYPHHHTVAAGAVVQRDSQRTSEQQVYRASEQCPRPPVDCRRGQQDESVIDDTRHTEHTLPGPSSLSTDMPLCGFAGIRDCFFSASSNTGGGTANTKPVDEGDFNKLVAKYLDIYDLNGFDGTFNDIAC